MPHCGDILQAPLCRHCSHVKLFTRMDFEAERTLHDSFKYIILCSIYCVSCRCLVLAQLHANYSRDEHSNFGAGAFKSVGISGSLFTSVCQLQRHPETWQNVYFCVVLVQIVQRHWRYVYNSSFLLWQVSLYQQLFIFGVLLLHSLLEHSLFVLH